MVLTMEGEGRAMMALPLKNQTSSIQINSNFDN
jgi:hypothetical protein